MRSPMGSLTSHTHGFMHTTGRPSALASWRRNVLIWQVDVRKPQSAPDQPWVHEHEPSALHVPCEGAVQLLRQLARSRASSVYFTARVRMGLKSAAFQWPSVSSDAGITMRYVWFWDDSTCGRN